jgi:hypothetical protein
MRKILYLLLLLPILAIAQSPDQNWIKTKTYKEPTLNALVTPTPVQAVTQVSYFDGLGRSIQQVAHAQSNTGKDIITHIEYDAFGRVEKEFLPYANQTASLNYNASAGSNVLGFYSTIGYENTSNLRRLHLIEFKNKLLLEMLGIWEVVKKLNLITNLTTKVI